MRLLVLDDERGIVTFIATVARDRGWTVDTAITETEFRANFTANPPDAITLDLQLGRADGIEQLRFLRTVGFEGPIVLLSGFDARVLESARQLGESLGLFVSAALEKPVRISRLREVLGVLEGEVGQTSAGSRSRDAAPADAITADAVLSGLSLGEMDLFLQPIVGSLDREIRRYEALIRWHHPELGTVTPDSFIPAAEQDEATIDYLTFWGVKTAVDKYRRLAERGCEAPISVNVSGVNLRDLDFPDRVAGLVEQARLPHSAICFEITESVATSDPGRTIDILARLRLKGFALAMDDFGTGYSTLKALQKMPFSELKIDKSFVLRLPNADSMSIINSVVGLARNLNLECVAEGVETAEADIALSRLGASSLQGYRFSRPLPIDGAIEWHGAWDASRRPMASEQRMHGK
ncbi:MAG TPA: EAL domain-containing response regulator [Stellaceae bacterium]|nr:EAL domain-containing response regulator [Stellaceae bacterium]